MGNTPPSNLPFLARVGVALRCFWQALTRPEFARQARALLGPGVAAAPAASAAVPPEQAQAPALHLLSLLQREGRLIDFLQEDIAGFDDAEVGAAARVVHAGCRRVLTEGLTLEPALREADGASVTVPAGFDAQRIRLTGKVAGQPPFRGVLRHHGWVATAVQLPTLSPALDPRVLAPAEVEL
ncbi:MAG: DUF2760 domain-containing protein [Verrucomicrobiales bacterium]|nr:DUF2760 domain-containing protein [Verrucomicrobiales bacterium]